MSVESLQSQEECTSSETKMLARKPNPGKTINNFVTRSKSLVVPCDYGKQEDNQVRDIVITNATNKELKSKFYREENLSLSRLLKTERDATRS